jgi:hypothetical protein
MRVQLATASLVLPSIVGAKLPKRRQSGRAAVGEQGTPLQLLRQARSNEPLWKSHESPFVPQQAVHDADNSNQEPDVGILSASQRNLQTQSSTTSDLCQLANTKNTKCDCSNWSNSTGSFECSLFNGNTRCFDQFQPSFCASVDFGVSSDGTYVMLDYCVNTTKPSVHSYCTSYQKSIGSGGTFGFLGTAGTCTITVDNKQCHSCTVQTGCRVAKGTSHPGPGMYV